MANFMYYEIQIERIPFRDIISWRCVSTAFRTVNANTPYASGISAAAVPTPAKLEAS